jgi:uncharacterized damage-inducible protein DinB
VSIDVTEAEGLALKLVSEGERLHGYLKDLGAADWDSAVYTEGSVWTVRSIVAHIVTAERAFVRLFDGIRHGGSGVSDDFEIDRYNARQQEKMRDVSPDELLQQFQTVRSAMVSLVGGLADSDLDRQGRHPFLGVTSLRDMIKMIYIHNQTHYRDVRRALKG